MAPTPTLAKAPSARRPANAVTGGKVRRRPAIAAQPGIPEPLERLERLERLEHPGPLERPEHPARLGTPAAWAPLPARHAVPEPLALQRVPEAIWVRPILAVPHRDPRGSPPLSQTPTWLNGEPARLLASGERRAAIARRIDLPRGWTRAVSATFDPDCRGATSAWHCRYRASGAEVDQGALQGRARKEDTS